MNNEGQLIFALNGQKVALPSSSVDANLTINDHIRTKTSLKGTKLACGEGGCGACAVVLSRICPIRKTVIHVSANSCLRPLASCDGWAITTTEGLGAVNGPNGLHPVQDRIYKMNGSQCGFCTPGMVMTTYAALLHAGEKGATMADIEAQFDGNICRCTGYRPILDAAKTFAKDSDIEDMVCKVVKPGDYDHKVYDPPFPAWLAEVQPESLHFRGSNGVDWFRPTSLDGLFTVLGKYPSNEVKLVGGNTSIGIYKEEAYKVYVDVHVIPELLATRTSELGVTIGASVTLAQLIELLKEQQGKREAHEVSHVAAITAHLWRIANVHVRNTATVAGNLTLAKTKGFISDLATLMVGIGSTVTLAKSSSSMRTISVEEYLSVPTYDKGEIIVSITLPWAKHGDVFNSYKVAARPQNSHAFVNAAFQVNVDAKTNTVTHARIAYGGVMELDKPGSHTIHATKVEEFLKGKPADGQTLSQALAILRDEVKPDGAERRAYRERLVHSLFYKFFIALCRKEDDPATAPTHEHLHTAPRVTHGRQTFKFPDEQAPISEAIPKIGADMQASGEALYTDDLAQAFNGLYAAYVQSTVANGTIVSIDHSEAMRYPGVVAFITARDIQGTLTPGPMGIKTPVFATKEVKYWGQPIGVIVADSQRHAEAAAGLMKIKYEEQKPILTLQDCLDTKSIYPDVPIFPSEQEAGSGDEKLKDDKHYLTGEVRLGTQYHFYIENQVAYAIPDEDGGVTIHTAHQWPDGLQSSVALTLGVPMYKVKILNRRAGGGFGGKAQHAVTVACAAAVAAVTTKRPIKFQLNRNEDMNLCGGREETDMKYEIAFNEEGKLSTVKYESWRNGGAYAGLALMCSSQYLEELPQVYEIPNVKGRGRVLMTNTAPRTSVRGPAEPESSYSIETILAHIAHELKLPNHVVRERNFLKAGGKASDSQSLGNWTLPRVWDQCKKESKFEQRLEAVQKFNAENRWRKRGIAITPARYAVAPQSPSALVNIYGDGSVIVHQSGQEIGQGLYTKVIQMAAFTLGQIGTQVDVSHIKVEDTNTSVLPNAGFTGGSTTSESNAAAVAEACKELVSRLKPVLASLETARAASLKKNPDDESAKQPVTWVDLCSKARSLEVNLSAMGTYVPTEAKYQTFGACVSEVEVDCLTGDWEYRYAHLVYDAGKSLNPAIDVGQAEGAFMFGVGYFTREEYIIDEKTGRLVSNGTWEYKPPGARDVPKEFIVELLQDSFFEKGVLGSKAVGEPPLVLACSAIMAIRDAIAACRKDNGRNDFFKLESPAKPEVIQALCAVDPKELTVS